MTESKPTPEQLRELAFNLESYIGDPLLREAAAYLRQMADAKPSVPKSAHVYAVRFHKGPCAGDNRLYPRDPGERIVFPCENGSEVIYERDTSEMAKLYLEDTGLHVYECTFNGAALPYRQQAEGTKDA